MFFPLYVFSDDDWSLILHRKIFHTHYTDRASLLCEVSDGFLGLSYDEKISCIRYIHKTSSLSSLLISKGWLHRNIITSTRFLSFVRDLRVSELWFLEGFSTFITFTQFLSYMCLLMFSEAGRTPGENISCSDYTQRFSLLYEFYEVGTSCWNYSHFHKIHGFSLPH